MKDGLEGLRKLADAGEKVLSDRTIKSKGKEHNNLFAYGHSKREVYGAFQRDMRRDSRQFLFVTCAAIAVLVIAADKGLTDGWPWFIFGICGLLQAGIMFIDMSNRNFMMHVIDWIEYNDAASEKP